MKNKKRLLFFDFITHFGGAQRSTVLLCKRLKDQYDIQIVDAYGYCNPYLVKISDSGLPLHILMQRDKGVVIGHSESQWLRLASLFKQMPHFLILTKRLITTIKKLKPDLIWTNNIKSLFFLSCCSYFNGIPIGLYAHGWYQKRQIPRWQRIIIRKYVDIVFAVSNPTKSAMVNWGVDAQKIHVVYAAVDLDGLIRRSSTPSSVNQEKPNAAFTILVPGSLLYTKGQHTVIEAVKLLKENKQQAFVVWFAGDIGVGDTSRYADFLKQKVIDYELADHVDFLGWRNDLPALMHRADVVVLPTYTEGLPLIIQEAIMLKCPVISTKVGGITDLIKDGRTGFTVDIEDGYAIAKNIEMMIKYPNVKVKIVDRAYDRYISTYNEKRQVRLFLSAVKSIV